MISIDKNHDIPIYPKQCVKCKHLSSEKPQTCKAFPDGIPRKILLGKHNHKNYFPGDRGIRFEPLEEGDK